MKKETGGNQLLSWITEKPLSTSSLSVTQTKIVMTSTYTTHCRGFIHTCVLIINGNKMNTSSRHRQLGVLPHPTITCLKATTPKY